MFLYQDRHYDQPLKINRSRVQQICKSFDKFEIDLEFIWFTVSLISIASMLDRTILD